MKEKKSCGPPADGLRGGCRVESLISVDERGQMVLPKEFREKASIKPGDKLALVSWEKEGAICCMTLIKAEYLAERVRDLLGPLMTDLSASRSEPMRRNEK